MFDKNKKPTKSPNFYLVLSLVLGILGLLLLIFTIQNFFGSMGELEPTASYLFLLITGLPALAMVVTSVILVLRYQASVKERFETKDTTVDYSSRYCKSCGKKVAEGMNYCHECGTPIIGTINN